MAILQTLRDFVAAGGITMTPVLFTAGIVAVLTVRAVRRLHVLRSPGLIATEEGRPLEGSIDAILFWGLFAAIIGVLGTLGGLAQMARAIETAGGEVGGGLVWGGLRVALNNTLLGLTILAVALPVWYALRRRWARLVSS